MYIKKLNANNQRGIPAFDFRINNLITNVIKKIALIITAKVPPVIINPSKLCSPVLNHPIYPIKRKRNSILNKKLTLARNITAFIR